MDCDLGSINVDDNFVWCRCWLPLCYRNIRCGGKLPISGKFWPNIFPPFFFQYLQNCQGKLNDEDKETQLLISSLIIPLYMTMGIIFWILLLVLLIMQPFALRTASSGQPKQKRKNGRSLSEIPSQEYTNRLNKRFDQADALEEDEQRSSSRNSEELLIKRSNGNNNNPMKLKTRETSSTSGNLTSFIFTIKPHF